MRASTRPGSAGGCGCTAPSPTDRSAPPRSSPSSPHEQAVDLPDEVPDELGACLGIPGITAHRAVFADGPVAGATVLVQGVLGGVGALAAQLAHWGGATVIGTVRRSARP